MARLWPEIAPCRSKDRLAFSSSMGGHLAAFNEIPNQRGTGSAGRPLAPCGVGLLLHETSAESY